MKNYFMQLIVLNSVFIVCNISAMEELHLSLLDKALISFGETYKFEAKRNINNRILMVGKFQSSETMVQETQKVSLNLHTKTDKPILLCPNMNYERTYGNRHWVCIERYTERFDSAVIN